MIEFWLIFSASYVLGGLITSVAHWLMDKPEDRSLSWTMFVGLIWPYSTWYYFRYMWSQGDEDIWM